jgi:ribonucleoside-diphosphate reductase subunit M2
MENVHSTTYSLLIETYVQDPVEKDQLFNATQNFPSIKMKSDWAKKWINDNRSSFSTRLIAFAIIEGLFFSSSFAAIFWIKQRNILPGLCLSNEYISRDEGLHVEHAVLLYSKLKKRVPKKKFIEIMKEAVSLEIDFIVNAVPCRLIGMNSDLMTEYIKFVADRLCLQLGYDKIFNANNPFPFMELISIEKKTNFFEHRVSEYALANKTKDDDIFDMNCDF